MIEAVFAAPGAAGSAASTVAAANWSGDWAGIWAQTVHVLSFAAILAGSFFVLVGAVGMIRMPDLFTRMHAASVIDTLGAGLLIAGMMMQAGPTLITLKLLFILLLFFITSPVATHALAQAALHDGIKPELLADRRGTSSKSTSSRPGEH